MDCAEAKDEWITVTRACETAVEVSTRRSETRPGEWYETRGRAGVLLGPGSRSLLETPARKTQISGLDWSCWNHCEQTANRPALRAVAVVETFSVQTAESKPCGWKGKMPGRSQHTNLIQWSRRTDTTTARKKVENTEYCKSWTWKHQSPVAGIHCPSEIVHSNRKVRGIVSRDCAPQVLSSKLTEEGTTACKS